MATVSGSISTSYPTTVQTPQSDWELQLSQLLASIGQSQYQWAQQTYNSTSALTDQQINSYLQLAQQGQQLAGNEINRYENIYQPLENQYINEAQTYASVPRIARNMGAAESDTAQAANTGRINAESTLQSYGIDPSAGRYAELEDAQRTQAAAAEAGAGQQAELATEQTGQQMLLNAVNIGQQYPGAAVNSLNSAYQGVAGAENSVLGLANTGVNLMDSAAPYYNAAMSLRYPPTGQITNSRSATNSGTGQPGKYDPFAGPSGATPFNENSIYSGTAGKSSPSSGPSGVPPYMSPADIAAANGANASDAAFNTPAMDPNAISGSPSSIDQSLASGNYDPYSAYPNNTGGGASTDQSLASGNFDPYGAGAGAMAPTTDWSSPQPDYSSSDLSGYTSPDTSASAPSPSSDPGYYDPAYGGGSDYAYGDTSAPTDYSTPTDYSSAGSSGDDSGYAQGGGVLPHGNAPTTGGFVPRQASPSMGRNTDDISARLNAGEFVVPRDVAAWKGQEFFQRLIEESRRKRLGAPAKGKPKAPLNGPPRFASHPMQQTGAR